MAARALKQQKHASSSHLSLSLNPSPIPPSILCLYVIGLLHLASVTVFMSSSMMHGKRKGRERMALLPQHDMSHINNGAPLLLSLPPAMHGKLCVFHLHEKRAWFQQLEHYLSTVCAFFSTTFLLPRTLLALPATALPAARFPGMYRKRKEKEKLSLINSLSWHFEEKAWFSLFISHG